MHYLTGVSGIAESALNIDALFSSSDKVLHRARNVIKEVPYDGTNLIIKSFRIPGLWGRLVYTFFRRSKARRSFEYSLSLNDKNIKVPAPVACVECYESGLLKSSFYLSEKFSYDCTLHEVLRDEMFSCETVLPEVARFAYAMHQQGFLHLDFSPGNILVKETNGTYQLAMVDVNRMRFGQINFELGLKGFTRLLRNQKGVVLLAHAYAECANQDQAQAVEKLQQNYQEYTRHAQLLQRLKAPLKRMVGRS